MKLQGKTAIVTGAASGIGKEIAIRYAREGAKVAIADLNLDAANATAALINASGGQAMGLAMDVTVEEAVNDGVAAVVKAFGGVHVLVSNAGIQIVHPVEEFSFAVWKKMLAIHLDGAFLTTRACLPHMMARRWGRIIHMSGRDGFFPKANRAHNVTCKAGSFALAKAIAVEFGGHGITANAIAPGIIETSRDPAHYPDAGAGFEARRQAMPVQRLGNVGDIAGACSYLCSEAGGYVTGQVLHVNGGEFMF